MAEPLETFKVALSAGDAGRVRSMLSSDAALRGMVDEPLGHFGSRPVQMAAKHLAVLDALIDHGADINLRSDWSEGPFSVLDSTDADTTRHLMGRGAILTAHAASRLGWIDDLRHLLDEDPARVYERGGDGKRPLHWAANVTVATLLLDRGADLDARCTDHLSTAAQYLVKDQPDVSRLLLERGTTPDVYLAAWLGNLDSLGRQVAENPGVLKHRIGRDGYNRVPSCTMYNWIFRPFMSPHAVALEAGHRETWQLLWDASDAKTQLLDACWRADEPAARQAVDRQADVLQTLGDDGRLLADACHHGKLDAARLMLSLGFDPAHPGIDGGTALHQACWVGRLDLVQHMLTDPRAVKALQTRDGTHGGTPADWASHGRVHGPNCGGDFVGILAALRDAAGT